MNGLSRTKSPLSPAAPKVSARLSRQRLAREGCQVIIADVNEAGVNATAAAIAKETGRRVLGHEGGRDAGSGCEGAI